MRWLCRIAKRVLKQTLRFTLEYILLYIEGIMQILTEEIVSEEIATHKIVMEARADIVT
jgi:hypothetical protein